MSNPAPGTHLGPFQIEGVIGAGSMGDVFRGHDTGLHRKVAIKILSEKHRDSPELRARFTREGRAVAAIQHPNVVQVFSTGTFDDRPYIAMELLDGIDLGTAVEENGPLPALQAARALLDAARGLEAAAKAGLIHRDVKPSNLVLLPNGKVKVTDFGLAKPVDPGSEPSLTALGVVVGTPDYIAPEQARGETIDERVDLYALGGTLYFLLTGMPPFRTGKPAEDKYLKVVARHLRQPAPDARTINPAADVELADIARALMAKKPAERPDYASLVARLEKVVARLESGGATAQPLARAADGSGGLVGKTPFVGGDRPHGFAEPGGGDAGEPAGAGLGPAANDEAARTAVRPRTVPPGDAFAREDRDDRNGDDTDESLSELGRGGLPLWLKAFTAIAVVVFVVGLVVYLTRGKASGPGDTGSGSQNGTGAGSGSASASPGASSPGASSSSAPTTGSAGAPTPAPGASAPAPGNNAPGAPGTPGPISTARAPSNAPPAGMLLVARNDGTPWFFVDAHAVTVGELLSVFPKEKRPPHAKDSDPATHVPYTYARAYAKAIGKRLLANDEEWHALTRAAGHTDAPGLWEWVDVTGAGAQRMVRRGNKSELRPAVGQADVTFRCAQDLPATAAK